MVVSSGLAQYEFFCGKLFKHCFQRVALCGRTDLGKVMEVHGELCFYFGLTASEGEGHVGYF